MLLTTLALLFSASTFVSAQEPSLNGMWASGSHGVQTGAGFAEPQDYTFVVPKTTGIAWSFNQNNGTWESSRFRMTGNGKNPQCVTTTVFWAHGTFQMQSNGSMNCSVLEGYQHIENPCLATSSFTEMYNQTYEYYELVQFSQDTEGIWLHLFDSAGNPSPPMGQVSSTPNMLPIQKIINNNRTTVLAALSTKNAAPRVHPWSIAAAVTVGALLGSAFLINVA